MTESVPPATAGPHPPGAVLTLGAGLAQVLDRLARRHAQLSAAQYRVLAAVGEATPTAAEPRRLAAGLRMSSAHITTVLDQLAVRGLVSRAVHPEDARRRIIALTDEGRDRLEHFAAVLTAVDERVLAGALDADERRLLAALLARADAALDALLMPEGRPRPGP
ncbi:MAG: MarR family transcriptional regulator [Miltoncostaeaceae bacterium]